MTFYYYLKVTGHLPPQWRPIPFWSFSMNRMFRLVELKSPQLLQQYFCQDIVISLIRSVATSYGPWDVSLVTRILSYAILSPMSYCLLYGNSCGFPGGSVVKKKFVCNAGDPGSIPGLERSPGEGNGKTLQYSCLENSVDEEPGRLQSTGMQRVRHD